MLELGPLLNPLALSAVAGAVGLAIAEGQVSKAITDISTELENIKNNGFATDGYIATGSFGRGAEAADLAREHRRAHQVVVYSLTETISDLEKFRDAIREAKNLIGESDADAKERLTAVLARTESLALGTTTGPEPAPALPSGAGPVPTAPEGTDS